MSITLPMETSTLAEPLTARFVPKKFTPQSYSSYAKGTLLEKTKSLAVVERVTPGTKVVFCVWCANTMSLEKLTEHVFQLSCPTCGTSGPRRPTEREAILSTTDIFKE